MNFFETGLLCEDHPEQNTGAGHSGDPLCFLCEDNLTPDHVPGTETNMKLLQWSIGPATTWHVALSVWRAPVTENMAWSQWNSAYDRVWRPLAK